MLNLRNHWNKKIKTKNQNTIQIVFCLIDIHPLKHFFTSTSWIFFYCRLHHHNSPSCYFFLILNSLFSVSVCTFLSFLGWLNFFTCCIFSLFLFLHFIFYFKIVLPSVLFVLFPLFFLLYNLYLFNFIFDYHSQVPELSFSPLMNSWIPLQHFVLIVSLNKIEVFWRIKTFYGHWLRTKM